jgi:hypothetical protein
MASGMTAVNARELFKSAQRTGLSNPVESRPRMHLHWRRSLLYRSAFALTISQILVTICEKSSRSGNILVSHQPLRPREGERDVPI